MQTTLDDGQDIHYIVGLRSFSMPQRPNKGVGSETLKLH